MSIRAPYQFLQRVPLLNDVHSALNSSQPIEVRRPESLAGLVMVVDEARDRKLSIIPSGSRHAMGGQQFCEGGVVIDSRGLDRVLSFDAENGTIEVEAGIQWPAIVDFLRPTPWSIVQKQTGADRLTLGGAIASNVHGRGLQMRPLIQDIDSLTLVDARGEIVVCSRTENVFLFRHVVGGYGVFGIVYSVRLRLQKRCVLRRTVRQIRSKEVIPAFEQLIADGFLYGDWQFAIDDRSGDFLDLGILSAYRPTENEKDTVDSGRQLSDGDWRRLLLLAHTDKTRAFAEYSRHYLATDGQIYGSDTHQLTSYEDSYHTAIDHETGARVCGSEMITELYVPRCSLHDFLGAARLRLRASQADVIYGTVRLIEQDTESALPWARGDWACIIFNLHVDHEPRGVERARIAFRGLIDCALAYGGSYYLTYHRWATKSQVLTAHPALPDVLAAKLQFDPEEVFQSDWYRHHRDLIAL